MRESAADGSGAATSRAAIGAAILGSFSTVLLSGTGAQRQISQRMESLGRFAGVVVHGFDNRPRWGPIPLENRP